VVFQLTPSGSGWTENVLYTFQNGSDGAQPEGGLIFDSSGNLYGTTSFAGGHNGGTAFELTPSNGGWKFTPVYGFNGFGSAGPTASPSIDNGNLYGTTDGDGASGYGDVWELTPSNGVWTYTSLYDFTGRSDGAFS